MRLSALVIRALGVALFLGACLLGAGVRLAVGEPEGFVLNVSLRHRDNTIIEGGRITVFGPDTAEGPPWAFRQSVAADAKGQATFHLPKAGVYEVFAVAPDHRSVSTTVKVTDERFPTSFQYVWAAGPAIPTTFSVKDMAGTPIEDARVRVTRDRREDDEVKPPVHESLTDAAGKAVLHVAGSGRWNISVIHSRYETDELTFDLGEHDDPLTISTMLQPKEGATTGGKTGGVAGESPREPAKPEEPKTLRVTSDAGGPGRPPTGRTTPTTGTTGETSDGGTSLPRSDGAETPANAPASFAGRWRHVSGTFLELSQSGSTVTGSWTHLDSRLTGTVKGKVLQFTTTSPKGLECSGRVTLDAAGSAFFGEARVTQSATDAGRRFHFDAERAR